MFRRAHTCVSRTTTIDDGSSEAQGSRVATSPGNDNEREVGWASSRLCVGGGTLIADAQGGVSAGAGAILRNSGSGGYDSNICCQTKDIPVDGNRLEHDRGNWW